MRKMNKRNRGFVRNIRKTFKNKIVALAMLALGIMTTAISNDATALVFIMFISIPMFFARKNWVY